MIDKINQTNHEFKIIDRAFISLSGIIKIISFNDEEFLLETIMGNMHIKGDSLEVIKMDTTDGIVKIKGSINGVNYIEGKSKNKEESIIAKLFR